MTPRSTGYLGLQHLLTTTTTSLTSTTTTLTTTTTTGMPTGPITGPGVTEVSPPQLQVHRCTQRSGGGDDRTLEIFRKTCK